MRTSLSTLQGCNILTPDNDGNMSLHWLLDSVVHTSILQWGHNVNVQNKAGETPLHWAIARHSRNESCKSWITQCLLKYGVDLTINYRQ